MNTRLPTASLVIIGNELLNGKVIDANGPYLIRRLREIGHQVTSVMMVTDDFEAIGEAVRLGAERNDIVITSGGVGPTHDDLTIEAIARAFDVDMEAHPRLVALVKKHFGDATHEGHLRLARVPQGSLLLGAEEPPWPTVFFRNIYILPGIPRLLRAKFEILVSRFEVQPLFMGSVTVEAFEADICATLNQAVANHPDVEIGSYPKKDDGVWSVRLTIEGRQQAEVESAWSFLAKELARLVTTTERVISLTECAAPTPKD